MTLVENSAAFISEKVHPVAFYFDAKDRPGEYRYDLRPKRTVFDNILELDTEASLRFPVLSGDLMLMHLAYRPTRSEVGQNFSSNNLTPDKDLFITLMWDYSDSLTEGWSTLDIGSDPLVLAKRDIYMLVLGDLPLTYAQQVDVALRSDSHYFGAAALDLGNPLQLASARLPSDFYYECRSLHFFSRYGQDDSETLGNSGEWWTGLPFNSVDVVSPEQVDLPKSLDSRPLSERGAVSKRLLDRRLPVSHFARVVRELGVPRLPSTVDTPTRTIIGDIGLDPVIPEAKLVRYCLNLDDRASNGYHKAVLFRDALGITAADWRYLADQLVRGLPKAEVNNVRATTYGVQYHTDIPVRGLNGSMRNVRAGWIIIGDSSPRLTTAFVPDRSIATEIKSEPASSFVVGRFPGKADSEYWFDILDLAARVGADAAASAIPTPMFIDGCPPIAEGVCGGASVLIPDARRRFSRWLLEAGHAAKSDTGVRIHVNVASQSMERAEAYADAMAQVFRANGIECSVRTDID
jgi:hypothetical protein